jgi:heme-degrading monooxygenase HmoA
MILEIADIRILSGQNAAFEAAICAAAQSTIGRAQGFQGYTINQGIENPERYVLQVFWNTLEDHTVGFRQSEAFTQWRTIIGPFFASPPVVEHFHLVAQPAG